VFQLFQPSKTAATMMMSFFRSIGQVIRGSGLEDELGMIFKSVVVKLSAYTTARPIHMQLGPLGGHCLVNADYVAA
jgi:hypothetical protein